MDDQDTAKTAQRCWSATVDCWRAYDEMEARLTRPVSERMLDLAGVASGMRVLDVACGRGEPAISAAHRVGAGGRVVGVDLVEGMLELARAPASAEGLTNIELLVADAQALQRFEPPFDVCTVRWGLMYMQEPERALEAIARTLKPGGALVIASWSEPHFALLPRRTLARFRDVPPPPPQTPSVFRHAAPDSLDLALERAGFGVEASERMDVAVVEARDGEGFVEWVRALGGALKPLVEELPAADQQAWAELLAQEAERFRLSDAPGLIRIGGTTRLTLARKSAVAP